MDSVTDLLRGLASEVGMLYSVIVFLIGLFFGILMWRFYNKSATPTDSNSFVREIEWLENESGRIVAAVSELWQQVGLPPIKQTAHSQQVGRVASIRPPERKRWWRRVNRKRRRSSQSAEQRPALEARLPSRLAQSNARLNQQADKIRRAIQHIPAVRGSTTHAKGLEDFYGGPGAEDVGGNTYPIDSWHDGAQGQTTRDARDTAGSTRSGSDVQGDEHLDAGRDLLQLYNNAVSDSFVREQFRESYQPLRIGTVNAVERRQNPTAVIKPEFRETTDGDFFAISLSKPNKYAVLPRLGLTIGAVSYNAGALGEMFGNPSYDPAQSYSRYRVRKPAIFKCEGEHWILEKPGELDLGPGD